MWWWSRGSKVGLPEYLEVSKKSPVLMFVKDGDLVLESLSDAKVTVSI